MKLNLIIIAAFSSLLLAVSGAAYWYYQDSQSRIQTLQGNNAQLEIAVEQNEATINSLQNSYERSRQELRNVNEEFRRIRRQNNVLAEKLERHDLGLLGNARPDMVERIVNNATDKVNRCFEILSGAEFTEEEINAETAEQANSECPWLYHDRNHN